MKVEIKKKELELISFGTVCPEVEASATDDCENWIEERTVSFYNCLVRGKIGVEECHAPAFPVFRFNGTLTGSFSRYRRRAPNCQFGTFVGEAAVESNYP